MKKFYSFLIAMLALVGVAQAQTITFDIAANPWNLPLGSGTGETAAAGNVSEIVQDGVTLSLALNADKGTPPRMWTGNQLRIYTNNTLTFTAGGKTIQKVVFTYTANNNNTGDAKTFSNDVDDTTIASNEEWTGSVTSLTFSPQISKGSLNVSRIEVTLKNDDPTYVAAPKITPATGTYYAAQTVTITADEDCKIYYTTDGGDPKASDAIYAGPFTVEQTTTVKAVAAKGDNMSDVVESVITIETLQTQTIADVLTAGAGAGNVSALVVAAASTGVLLQDATGFIFAYTGSAPAVAVGDEVTVSGPTAEYGGRLQFTEKATITKTGAKEVVYPDPVVLDGAAFDALVGKIEVKYVEVSGTITSVGNYNNFKITGATNTGSLIAPADVLSQLTKDAVVKITGFFVYVTGSTTKYGTIIATKVELPEIVYTEYNTLAEVKAAVTDAESYAQLNLTDILVTYVNGQSVYLFDGTDGMLVYGTNSKNLKTGYKISGSIKGKLYKRNGNTQIANPAYDVTVVSSDNDVVPQVVAAADLLADNGVAYENELVSVSYLVAPENPAWSNRSISFDAYKDDSFSKHEGVVAAYDNWSVATNLTFNEETPYTLTGLVAIYTKDNNTTVQIYPRTIADIDNGEEPTPFTPEGEGTLEKPYTVADVQGLYDATQASDYVWVKAYIIGSANGEFKEEKLVKEGGANAIASNIVVAATAGETALSKMIPVALPSGAARTALNLKDNADNLGKEVWVYGTIEYYFKVAGVKNVTNWSFDGVTTAVKDITVDAPAAKTIFTVAGQRVQNLNKRGLYIVNGKKVVVK